MDLTKFLPTETEEPVEGKQQLSKEEYAEVKKQEREEVWAEIDAKAQDVFKDGDSLKGFLDFVAQCAPQRTANLLLLYSQNPEIRQVKTFEKWKEEKRTLQTGAHGYRFIAGQEYEKDGEIRQGYSICKVYDVSQIRMKQPEPQEAKPIEELMAAMLKDTTVPVRIADNLPENVQAQYIPERRTIFVRNGMSESATFLAIGREQACAALDHHDGKYSRSKVSAQAFCAAYVMASKYGMDTSAFPLDRVCALQQNGNKDPKELRAFIGDVRNAAYEIGTRMDKNLGEQAQEVPAEEFNIGMPESDLKKTEKSGKGKKQPER